MILGVKALVSVDNHMIWWIWSLPGNLTTTKSLIKWYGTLQYETPLFGCLDPPIIEKTCKKKMHNHCVYVITWYTSVAVCKTDAYSYNTSALWSSPKWLASRIGPPTFRCPGAAPGKVIDLKFSGNMPSLVLGKVRKFQPRSSIRFGDIPEKTWGVDENTPLCH